MSRLLYIIDFDRTLANTELLYERFVEITGVDLSSVREEVEASGGSLDVISELRKVVGDELLTKHIATYEADRRADYLLDGAEELLAYVDEKHAAAVIMTYGSRQWQMTKIRATGLHERLPVIVTSSPDKASQVSEWRDEDGVYHLPIESGPVDVREVVLLDDKAVAFSGLTEEINGYWVQSGTPLPAQKGEVPAHVHHVPTLYDVVSLEKQRFVAS